MLFSLLGAVTSLAVLALSIGVIGHMLHAHWHQITMALNAQIPASYDIIQPALPARPLRVRIQTVESQTLRPRRRHGFRAAA